MPKKKRKKYPKLPSGFGTIRYLGAGRRNCYAVHPPAVADALGRIQRPAALCYVDDWVKGFTVLTAYKAGSYAPGMEKELEVKNTLDADVLIQRIVADYSTIKGVEDKHPEIRKLTFSDIYQKFYRWKFEENKTREFSDGLRRGLQAAYKKCEPLHNRIFADLKYRDFQSTVDTKAERYGSANWMVTLMKQMSKFAVMYEYIEEDKTVHLKANRPDDSEHGVPFSEEELKILWKNKAHPVAEFLLIMCYSGYRIKAYRTMQVFLEEKYFLGGVKTESGKNRMVPIHSGIQELVERRLKRDGGLLTTTEDTFRKHLYPFLSSVGIERHTPHDCRHTFSMLCEKYQVNENDRKRLLGHSFGNDLTNAVYGHRSLEDLRTEIEKIQLPDL